MKKLNYEDFDEKYVDTIEVNEIDKFVCREMIRQVHRYIKAMKGSKMVMDQFTAYIDSLDLEGKQKALAQYIDLNRKVLKGCDFKMVLARAIANYCDTFEYMHTMINNRGKMIYYLHRIKDTYVKFHEIFEENGKYGMRDHEGNILLHPIYDFLRTPYVYVDELMIMPVIAEKDGKMGLVRPDGKDTIVADFVYDDVSLRTEPPFFEARKGKMHGTLDRYGRFEEQTLNS